MEKLYTPYIVAFSGGCFSGKTTTINKVANELKQLGYNIIILEENIRNKEIFKKADSIDNIRQNPNSYLLLQNEIIKEKIEKENKIIGTRYSTKTVVLVDRALTDSLFYLSCYVDKVNLTLENKKIFRQLFNSIYTYLLLTKRYNKVLEFMPIKKVENLDNFRPKNLEQLHFFEYKLIHCFNNQFFTDDILDKHIKAENKNTTKYIINKICNAYR